jgi:hypothetical protein
METCYVRLVQNRRKFFFLKKKKEKKERKKKPLLYMHYTHKEKQLKCKKNGAYLLSHTVRGGDWLVKYSEVKKG